MSLNQVRVLKTIVVFALSLIVTVVLCGTVNAQETWGTVRGSVTDPSGAAVPGAQVQLSGGSMPSALTSQTDAAGTFTFGKVPPGTGYLLSVTNAGFRNARASGINVELGKASTVDISMEVGQDRRDHRGGGQRRHGRFAIQLFGCKYRQGLLRPDSEGPQLLRSDPYCSRRAVGRQVRRLPGRWGVGRREYQFSQWHGDGESRAAPWPVRITSQWKWCSRYR